MITNQPILLNQPTNKQQHRQQHPSGPIFEFGPGWGHKTKKWLKKYILAGDCLLCRNTRYILIAGIIILIIGWPQFKKMSHRQPQDSLTGQIKIAEIVRTGDSKIKLARRALADYLAQFPDPALTNGQKVYIETVLGQEIDSNDFRTGNNIELSTNDIKSVITQSKSLSSSQLQRWEAAAKGVKF